MLLRTVAGFSNVKVFNNQPNLTCFFIIPYYHTANTNKTPTHIQIYKAAAFSPVIFYLLLSSVCTISWQTFVIYHLLHGHPWLTRQVVAGLGQRNSFCCNIPSQFGFVVVFFSTPPSPRCVLPKMLWRARSFVFILELLNVCVFDN